MRTLPSLGLPGERSDPTAAETNPGSGPCGRAEPCASATCPDGSRLGSARILFVSPVPCAAGCGRLPEMLPVGGGGATGPMPAAARPALSAASFRWHLSSRNEPPGPAPPCPGTAGTRRRRKGSGCPRSGPSLPSFLPSRARLPRPPSHSSSQ